MITRCLPYLSVINHHYGARHGIALWLGLLVLALWGVPGLAQTSQMDIGALVALPEWPQAPDFTLVATQGQTHRLSDYRGRVVLINFWSVWCAPCRKEMPAMQRAWEQVRDQEVTILAVNLEDSIDQIAQFFAAIPVQFPILLGGDQAMMREWSIRALPTSLVIDPQGRARYRVIGEYHWDHPKGLEVLLSLRE